VHLWTGEGSGAGSFGLTEKVSELSQVGMLGVGFNFLNFGAVIDSGLVGRRVFGLTRREDALF